MTTLTSRRPRGARPLIHPGRLVRRTRRQTLQSRKLVLGPLMLDLQLRQRAAELLVLRPSRVTSPINSRTTPISSGLVMRSSESRLGGAIQKV